MRNYRLISRQLTIALIFIGITLTTNSCSLFTLLFREAVKPPVRFDNVVGAKILTVGSSTESARELTTTKNLFTIMEDGTIAEAIPVDEDGRNVSFPIKDIIKVDSRFVILTYDERSSGSQAAVRYGLVLLDTQNGKAYSLTPPSVQKAIDHVDKTIFKDSDSRIYGTLGLNIFENNGGGIWWNWSSSNIPTIQQDGAGNIYLRIGASIIVDGIGNEAFGSGRWYYINELVKIDISNMTQKSIYSIAKSELTDIMLQNYQLESYIVTKAGKVFYQLGYGGDMEKYDYVYENGVTTYLNRKLDVLNRHFMNLIKSDNGDVLFTGYDGLPQGNLHLYKLTEDGNPESQFSANSNRTIRLNDGSHYWLINGSLYTLNGSHAYWQKVYDEHAGLVSNAPKIDFDAIAGPGQIFQAYPLMNTLVVFGKTAYDAPNKLYSLDLSSSDATIKAVPGFENINPLWIKSGNERVIVAVFNPATATIELRAIENIEGEIIVSQMTTVPGATIGGEEVPLIEL